VNDREREQPQDILINIVLFADLRRPGKATMCWTVWITAWWRKKCGRMPKLRRRLTVEALAADLAKLCLETARVEKVRVRWKNRGRCGSPVGRGRD